MNQTNALAVVLTAVETVVLVQWLRLTRVASRLTAAGFFFAGILVEELIRFRGIKGRLPQGRELLLLLLGVAVEIAGWIVPLALGFNLLQTFAFLFAFLLTEHGIIATATNGGAFLRNLLNGLDFSAVEAVGGAVWLTNPTAGTLAILIVTSVLEHTQGVRQGLGLRA